MHICNQRKWTSSKCKWKKVWVNAIVVQLTFFVFTRCFFLLVFIWQISYFTYSFSCLTCNILSCSCNISIVHKVSFSRPIKRIHTTKFKIKHCQLQPDTKLLAKNWLFLFMFLQLYFLQILFLLYANICFIGKFSDPNAPTKKVCTWTKRTKLCEN